MPMIRQKFYRLLLLVFNRDVGREKDNNQIILIDSQLLKSNYS